MVSNRTLIIIIILLAGLNIGLYIAQQIIFKTQVTVTEIPAQVLIP